MRNLPGAGLDTSELDALTLDNIGMEADQAEGLQVRALDNIGMEADQAEGLQVGLALTLDNIGMEADQAEGLQVGQCLWQKGTRRQRSGGKKKR